MIVRMIRFLFLLGLGLLLSSPVPAHASTPFQADKLVGGDTQTLTDLSAEWFTPQIDPVATETESASNLDPDKIVYLTFDDGPDPVWTPQVLALLNRYHATGTFYMLGKNANTYPEVVLQVAENGHFLANHSYNHFDLTTVGWDFFYLEVHDTEQALRDALADRPDLANQVALCLRPPYGQANDAIYASARNMGYAISMWSLDTKDWASDDSDDVLRAVLEKVEPNKVILMHDGGENRTITINALALILHELTLQGYHFPAYCTAEGQAQIN